MIQRYIIFALLFIPSFLVAENIYEGKHKIDIWEESALKNAGTTQDILKVYSQSYKKWDKALNNAYKILMKKLPDSDKSQLRDSQRKWLAFKESEFRFMPQHIQRQGGSITKVISAQRKVSFIRNRVIELEAYIFIYDSPP